MKPEILTTYHHFGTRALRPELAIRLEAVEGSLEAVQAPPTDYLAPVILLAYAAASTAFLEALK